VVVELVKPLTPALEIEEDPLLYLEYQILAEVVVHPLTGQVSLVALVAVALVMDQVALEQTGKAMLAALETGVTEEIDQELVVGEKALWAKTLHQIPKEGQVVMDKPGQETV
tara:strand:- start:417 stop:752 length:336 start_codon:yes stop_codon:yes gene_type:complete